MNKRFNEDLISPEAQELLILASLIPVVITVVLSYSAGKLLLYNCTLSFWLMLKASTQSPKSFPIQSELTAVQSPVPSDMPSYIKPILNVFQTKVMDHCLVMVCRKGGLGINQYI